MGTSIASLRAPSFPLRRGPLGYFQMSAGDDVIDENIRQIIGTQPGERVMRPLFGCDLEDALFEPLDHVLVTRVQHSIEEALANWEQRVQVLGVDVGIEEALHKVRYTVRRRIKSTGQIDTVSGSLELRR